MSWTSRPKPQPPVPVEPSKHELSAPGDPHNPYGAGHLFKGACICVCDVCRIPHPGDVVQCICLDCPPERCGAKAPTSVGGRR
jgi:hypothetical protein